METEIVEVFVCPLCRGENYVVWGPKETSRKIACNYHFAEARVPQPSKDKDGNDITIELITTAGFYFTVERGKGLRGVRRERQEGKSWVEAEPAAIGKAEV